MERQQALGEVIMPGAHEVAGEFDAVGGLEFPLLAVKGALAAELLGEQVGSKRWSEHAAGKQAGFERRGDWHGIDFVFADMGEPLDDLKGEGGGFDVETLAGFLAEQAEFSARGGHFGVDDLAHDGGRALERLAQLAGAPCAVRGAWRGQPPVLGLRERWRRAFLPLR
jgi:hypothetical protein